jgi:hypothetical protein
MDGCLTLAPYIYIYKVALAYFESPELHWKFMNPVGTSGFTRLYQRTRLTMRRLGGTLNGTEVHDGLVVFRRERREERGERSVNRQKGLSQGLKRLFSFGCIDGGIYSEMTGEHTVHIPVDDGRRQSEGNAPNSGSGIVTDAFEFPDFIEGIGEIAKGDDLLGCVVKIACSTVVAQSLPLTQHLVLGSSCQRIDRGPAPHEPFPVFPPLPDLCLLQDNLREPDGVGISRPSPWQFTAVLTEPTEESRGKLDHTT